MTEVRSETEPRDFFNCHPRHIINLSRYLYNSFWGHCGMVLAGIQEQNTGYTLKGTMAGLCWYDKLMH